MKYGDVEKLHEAALITDEQRDRIIEHFKLKEDGGGKFLVIISIIGAVLVTAGIILLISSHWDAIPRGVKIACGILLMLGAHAGGWRLREGGGSYPKCGEALHLLGSGLFLANIALLGQIYNIVSRPPNAFLLWWAGLAALPWLLRSKAQLVLLLVAFGVWFGFEINERGSFIFCDNVRQILLYSLLGLVYLGAGYCLRATRFSLFSGVTEKSGLLVFLVFFYPLTWKDLFGGWDDETIRQPAFFLPAILAAVLLTIGVKNLREVGRQWRWTWLISFLAMILFMATVWFGCWQITDGHERNYYWGESWNYLLGAIVFFVFCLLQVQVGIQLQSPALVNFGIVFIALDILAAYLDLFGSMARTGVMFLVSGIFLILFGVYLERKRRKLMKRIKAAPPARRTA
jgi:uncharacterized membrane protein